MIIRFSFFIFLISSAFSMDVIRIEHVDQFSKKRSKIIENIFVNNYKVPNSLISKRFSTTCNKDAEALIHLCINERGEIEVVRIDYDFVNKSLKVFSKGEDL